MLAHPIAKQIAIHCITEIQRLAPTVCGGDPLESESAFLCSAIHAEILHKLVHETGISPDGIWTVPQMAVRDLQDRLPKIGNYTLNLILDRLNLG